MCLSVRGFNIDESKEILDNYGINIEEYLELSKSIFSELTCTIKNSEEI